MTQSKNELRTRPIGAANDIVDDYANGDAFLRQRLGGRFTDLEDLRSCATDVLARKFDRTQLVEELLAFNTACENSEAAIQRVRQLADPSSLVVITGQQPGFCGGPLYVIAKAATAIATARVWSKLLERPVHPVFWIASDDHDIDEVATSSLLLADGEFRHVRADLPAFGPPLSDILISDETLARAAEVLQLSRRDPNTAEPDESLFLPRAGERWSIWFARLLAKLFAKSGLILFEPASARRLGLPFLRTALGAPEQAVSALRLGAERIATYSTTPPLALDIPSCLFVVKDGRRQRFDPARHTLADVDSALERSASGLSADAALRTVLQSSIFPAVGVVGGPGETRYWLQLREIFEAYGQRMPLFVPRVRATFLTPTVRRAIEALRLTDEELDLDEDGIRERILSRPRPDADGWKPLADATLLSFDRLGEKLKDLGGSLPSRTQQARDAMASSLDRLLALGAQQLRDAEGVSEKRIRFAARSLRPLGKPQDRVLGPLPLALRYGIDLFDDLAERIDPLSVAPRFFEIAV